MSAPDIVVYKKMTMFFIAVLFIFSSCGIREKVDIEPDADAVIKLFHQSDFRDEADRKNYLQTVKKYLDARHTVGYSSDYMPDWLHLQLEVLQRFQIEYITYD